MKQLQHSSVGNPYFGIERKIIVRPCQSRDLTLRNAVIATIASSLVLLPFITWNPTSFLNFNNYTSLFSFFLLKHTASYKHVTVLLGWTAVLEYLESACKDVCLSKKGRGHHSFDRLLD